MKVIDEKDIVKLNGYEGILEVIENKGLLCEVSYNLGNTSFNVLTEDLEIICKFSSREDI